MNTHNSSLIKRLDQTPEDKYREMTTRPVGSLVLAQAGPAILANLVSAVYNLVDTYFVGTISTQASAAIGIAFVAMTLIQGVGFYLGQGTGNALSRHLGAKDAESASVMVSTGLVLSLALGLAIAVLGNVFIEPLCTFAGATPTILPYAKIYIGIVLAGAPFMCSELMLNMQLRFEGEAVFSMVAIMAGAVLNTVLTPALIYWGGLGIAGSAIATVVSEFMSFCLLLWEMRHLNITTLSPRYVRLSAPILREINRGGLPSFVRQMMLGLSTTILNNAAAPFGDAAIAAMAVVQRITGFGNYVQIGIGQGLQPVMGYNLGARRYGRVREGYHFAVRTALVAVCAIGVVTCVFAPQLIWFFRPDAEVVAAGTLALRLTSFSVALNGAAMITTFGLQTSGHMWQAVVLGSCRMGLVLAPVVVVLTGAFGLTGLQASQAVSDVIAALVALPMARGFLRELGEQEAAVQANDSAAKL